MCLISYVLLKLESACSLNTLTQDQKGKMFEEQLCSHLRACRSLNLSISC